MKSFTPGTDGAVVQYSEGNGGEWITLGAVGEGRNWYNDTDIEYKPGGSNFGWGSPGSFQPDSAWQFAEYPLTVLSGKQHLKLRFVLASGNATETGNQGFAFDNLSISEDLRGSVLEHFTNSAQEASRDADDVVDAFAQRNRSRVVVLQYHLDYPGEDPMNSNNPGPPGNREIYYGVPSAPYAILNGQPDPAYQYDYSGPDEEPDDELLEEVSFESSPFLLTLEVDWMDKDLIATVTATCKIESYDPNVQLYVVAMETSVTAYTGLNQDTEFRNVVLDMIPSPAGRLLGNEWISGTSVTKTFEWSFPEYVEDIEDLAVVAFITNRDENGIVLQTAETYLTSQVGIMKPRSNVGALSIYPNPSGGLVHVNLGSDASNYGKLLITDLSGKITMVSEVVPGYSIYQLDVSSLPQGMYMVSWIESGVLKSRNKLVRVR